MLPQNQWTVPLSSFSGTSASCTNAYNGSHQFDYAAKHNPMVFLDDTAGNGNATAAIPMSRLYAPLEQLQTDHANNTVANCNWITPEQFNDIPEIVISRLAHPNFNGVPYASTVPDAFRR